MIVPRCSQCGSMYVIAWREDGALGVVLGCSSHSSSTWHRWSGGMIAIDESAKRIIVGGTRDAG